MKRKLLELNLRLFEGKERAEKQQLPRPPLGKIGR